ncbi:TrmH family RNA methyltransferase [Flavobacterium cellulosilyticum]|uniref:tRNA (guanosine(18)-2'-O)-methyltransferase n=1 Tax=Flavobacterium cellulosilyticum TaxID=2541731 RepID=A0A4R5CGE2_9FLAO|nr:RNA methyltransferase [Flavobacterium cellulosilyticum]TDD98745.1 TrmH family RNA methyltransferase [Flavobacterium cellulosilyticum]
MIDLDYLNFLENILTENRKNKFLKVLENRTKHFTVVVEDIFQMHNASAVMRSCEVFGIQELNVIEQRYGKSIDKEIAMGAQKWVDINTFDSVTSCVDTIKNKGYQIIATTPHENDCELEDFDITKPSALFFGTERDGLSQEILQKADGFIKIPMVGFTESLNISVSASIIIQNLTRRLQKSKIEWQLSEQEILIKRMEWARNSIKDIKRIEERYYSER